MRWLISLALVACLFTVGCKEKDAAEPAAPATPTEQPTETP